MAVYDYECKECKAEFSVTHAVSEHESAEVRCPGCKSENVKQIVTSFTAKTSRKS